MCGSVNVTNRPLSKAAEVHWTPNKKEAMLGEDAAQVEQDRRGGGCRRDGSCRECCSRLWCCGGEEASSGANRARQPSRSIPTAASSSLVRGRTENTAKCQRCKPHWSKGPCEKSVPRVVCVVSHKHICRGLLTALIAAVAAFCAYSAVLSQPENVLTCDSRDEEDIISTARRFPQPRCGAQDRERLSTARSRAQRMEGRA